MKYFKLNTAKLFMLCNVSKRESENIKERRKIYGARDFAFFKYPIKFMNSSYLYKDESNFEANFWKHNNDFG
jgi:hypothetical protein